MPSSERAAELEAWSKRLEDPGEMAGLRRRFDTARHARAVEGEMRAAEAHRALTDAHYEGRHLRARAAEADRIRAVVQGRLEGMEATLTWRLGDRIRRSRAGRFLAACLRRSRSWRADVR